MRRPGGRATAHTTGRRGISGLMLTVPLAAAAQRPARIGYIQTATAEEQASLTAAFDRRLGQLGYVEGRNIAIERRFADGRQELLAELARDLVRSNVDVIVTGGNPVIDAVKAATTTIPVIMATSRDPIGSGYVASLARPGGNITGLTGDPTAEVQEKRLELLRLAIPGAARVAVLWNPVPSAAETYRGAIATAAAKLGLRLLLVEARGRDEFEAVFGEIARERPEGLVVLPDPIFFTARRQVVALATRHRLPAIFHAREFVEIGGLMSYGASLEDQFRRAADYVDRILRGARPADLPVEQPTAFELVINRTVSAALGVALSPELLLRADRVIE